MWLIQSPIMMWLIQKSYYDMANLMSHYNVANSKLATMRYYLQSLLLHGTSKARCYTVILYKILKSFLQSPNTNLALSYKAQILIWHYFYKAQILIWHYFIKVQILFWQLFHKAQVLIWKLSLLYFYKNPNANLASILQSSKPF